MNRMTIKYPPPNLHQSNDTMLGDIQVSKGTTTPTQDTCPYKCLYGRYENIKTVRGLPRKLTKSSKVGSFMLNLALLTLNKTRF